MIGNNDFYTPLMTGLTVKNPVYMDLDYLQLSL